MHSQRRSRNPNGNHYKLNDQQNIKSDFNAKSHSAFNNHETSRRKYIRRAQTFASNTQFSLVGIRKGFFEGDDGEGKSALRQTHKTHSFDCHKIKKSEILWVCASTTAREKVTQFYFLQFPIASNGDDWRVYVWPCGYQIQYLPHTLLSLLGWESSQQPVLLSLWSSYLQTARKTHPLR